MIEEIKLSISVERLSSRIAIIVTERLEGKIRPASDVSLWEIDGAKELGDFALPVTSPTQSVPVDVSSAVSSSAVTVSNNVATDGRVVVDNSLVSSDLTTSESYTIDSLPEDQYSQPGEGLQAAGSSMPNSPSYSNPTPEVLNSPQSPYDDHSSDSSSTNGSISRSVSNNSQHEQPALEPNGVVADINLAIMMPALETGTTPATACDSNDEVGNEKRFAEPDSVGSTMSSVTLGGSLDLVSPLGGVVLTVGSGGSANGSVTSEAGKSSIFSSQSHDEGDVVWMTSIQDMVDTELDLQLEKIEKDTRVSKKTFDIRMQKLITLQVELTNTAAPPYSIPYISWFYIRIS
jgi:hypothetical protein